VRSFFRIYASKSRSKGTFQKKHFYFKYTETKLILLFNLIALDFNAPDPAFHLFLNSARRKVFLVASLTNFAPRQFLERIVTADENWVHHYEPESQAQSMAWKRPTSPVAKNSKVNHQPVSLCLHFFGRWKMLFWFFLLQRVKPLTVNSTVICY
jgi:hypothetical protein